MMIQMGLKASLVHSVKARCACTSPQPHASASAILGDELAMSLMSGIPPRRTLRAMLTPIRHQGDRAPPTGA